MVNCITRFFDRLLAFFGIERRVSGTPKIKRLPAEIGDALRLPSFDPRKYLRATDPRAFSRVYGF